MQHHLVALMVNQNKVIAIMVIRPLDLRTHICGFGGIISQPANMFSNVLY